VTRRGFTMLQGRAGRLPLLAVIALWHVGAAGQPISFTPVAEGFFGATDLQFAPGDPTAFVSEQDGRIHVVVGAGPRPTPFLDIRDRVVNIGESGLLAFAFDPQWPADPFVYVHYTRELPTSPVTYQAVFSRFQADPSTRVANPGSEAVLLRITKPSDGPDRRGNGHQGGSIVFGNDGYLYLTVGDAQQSAYAQMTTNLVGTVLRLDVNGGGSALDCGEGPGIATVPANNPLSDGPGGNCDEILAYGLRNPWRMSFDSPTGTFWIGDVGEGTWEEVNILDAGANYGWPIMEGSHCTPQNPGCDQTGLMTPIWEYPRSEGQSIIGGYVYRGSNIPWLQGRYVYSDFISGRVWALDRSTGSNQQVGLRPGLATSLGSDASGELYLLDFSAGVYRIDPGPVPAPQAPTGSSPVLTVLGPNPVESTTTLEVIADVAGLARILLVDSLGRTAAALFDGYLEAGSNVAVPFDATSFAPGLYVVRLMTSTGEATARIVISR
jgi:glucose/arabinose dehydrogenase